MTTPLDLEAIEETYPVGCHACGDTVETCDGLYYDHGACDASGKPIPEGVERRAPDHVDDLIAEVRRLRDTRDAAAQGFDDLVVRVWRAATGDTHEGPANVGVLIEAVERRAAARMEPMTDAALDAACAAEDRATADDLLLDGTDGAHPAWWRGHDRAAEVWQGRAEAAEREAAMLRGETAGAAVSLGIISDDLDSTRRQLDAARADLARVTAERDAAFARGAAAMRGAAVAYFARRAEASRREARESDTYKRFGSYSAAYDNADRDERIAETIRALIEAPAGESGGERE